MLTKDIRKTIDNARDILVGKIPNPQSQIEQITIAMIYKFMDDMDIESVEFGGERQFFVEELSEYAWSKIMSQQLGNEARMNLYTEALDKLQLSDRIPKLFRDIFKGAYLPFRDGQTLTLFLKEINELSYSNSENLGNGFEYLLSIMGSQGDAGQFRTPRHIIDFIVDIVKPTKADTILDPACGTAGFLISAYKFIQKFAQDSKQQLTPQERTTLTENIQGYDISPDMVKLALVNMYLHKFKDPKIYEYDTLTQDTRWDNYFDCILANPPFMTPKGGIKPHNKFGVKANRSEVLFVDYIMEHLNSTGRAGVIVPEGIVFQSANAYKELRKKLVDENYLYAVVSLPSGIFQPYSGVKTSILFMDKQLAKKTDKVLFVEIQNDGFDLGAQRRPIDKNDLPKALEIINKWQNAINSQIEFSIDSKRIVLVEKSKLAEGEEYNLTASRYKVTQDFSNCKWKMVQLSDICELKRGTAITKKDIVEGNIPVIAGGQKPAYFHNEFNRSGETITVAGSGAYAGFINYYNVPIFVSDAFTIKPLDENICKTKYLYNVLKAKQDYVYSLQSGMGIPHLYTKDLIDYEIPLPPLEVQEEIVKELDGYQAVIDGAKKVTESYLPSFPTRDNWQQVKLGELYNISYGVTVAIPENMDDNGIKIISTAETTIDGYLDYSKIRKVKYLDKYQQHILKPNTLLFNWRNAPKHVGKTVIFEETDEKYICASFLLPMENIASERVINKWAWYEINRLRRLGYFMQNSRQAVNQTNFNGTLLADTKIYLPSIEEQEEMMNAMSQEEKAIEECKKLIKLHQEKINTKIQSIWGDSCEDNN